MKTLILIFAILNFRAALASPGVSSGATSGFHNPKDTTGLCTPDNKEQEFYQVGYCKAIYEKLVKNGCTKNLIEELRLRTLQDPKQPGWKNLKNKKPFNAFECDSKIDGTGKSQHIQDLAKDPKKYAEFMMQFFSLVSINESDWDPKLKHAPNAGQGDGAQGLLNLTRAKTDDQQYDKDCNPGEPGCKTDDTTDGKSPGPQDPNYSLTCGVHMGLFWFEKDNEAYGRDLDKAAKNAATKNSKPSPDAGAGSKSDEWTGAARVFPSLQNTKAGESPQSQMIHAKLKQYCEKYAFTGGMAPIEDDLNQDVGAGNSGAQAGL